MKTVSERKSASELNDILSVKELGQFLGIHANGAYDLVRSKDFPSVKVGKKFLILKAALMKWLEQQGQS